jgi:glycerophosphoryl diester phosphodiesterase
MKLVAFAFVLLACTPMRSQTVPNPYTRLMEQARAHAEAHHALRPVLSPLDATVVSGAVDVAALHALGFQVIPWTTNEPATMQAILRSGADGDISDRPDLLQQAVAQARAAAATPAEKARLTAYNVSGHRGGRGLRPENTLPAFEAGLDNLIDTIETDTGVTTDGVSLIWHDQFLNPQSCRRADGKAYTMANRVYIRDLSLAEAQSTFICDQLRTGPYPAGVQTNDLALSPVAVAFAREHKLVSPYVPTYAEQLFQFAAFYAEYYRSGPGRTTAHAGERALAGERVHFNLETKIIPDDLPPPAPGSPLAKLPAEMFKNHTVGPQAFVDALCGAIVRNHMQARADVQSFDFRTLILVEEQHPDIPTYYLTESPESLSTAMLPPSLRQGAK